MSERKQVKKILTLAERLVDDIRQRKLEPGDRYLSTAEAAKMLHVDTAAANRALQLLAKRNLIQRRQRAGTFIAEPSTKNETALNQIHILTGDEQPRLEGWLTPDSILALQAELPNVRIQFHTVPKETEQAYLQSTVNTALKAPCVEGFILMRSSLAMQRIMKASGLPALVFGHPYPSVGEMAFIDRDQFEMGRLAAKYLLEQGHKRLVVLMRQTLLPGDHLMLEGIRTIAAEAGLRADEVIVYCLPYDQEEVTYVVGQMLEDENPLPGIITRPKMMGDVAVTVLGEKGLKAGRDISLVVADYFGKANQPYASLQPTDDKFSPTRRLVKMIQTLACPEILDHENQLIPVRLIAPA